MSSVGGPAGPYGPGGTQQPGPLGPGGEQQVQTQLVLNNLQNYSKQSMENNQGDSSKNLSMVKEVAGLTSSIAKIGGAQHLPSLDQFEAQVAKLKKELAEGKLSPDQESVMVNQLNTIIEAMKSAQGTVPQSQINQAAKANLSDDSNMDKIGAAAASLVSNPQVGTQAQQLLSDVHDFQKNPGDGLLQKIQGEVAAIHKALSD